MPRNGSGIYSLPAGNPVVAGTTIESDWANTTLDDIAAAVTASLPRDGSAPMTGDLVLASSTPATANSATSKSYVDNFIGLSSGFPLGFIAPFAGSAVPTGFLICDGTAVSRTTYAALFAIIGTTYGSGDGVTTFNVPDLRNEFIRGRNSATRAVGSKQSASFAAHTHAVSDPGHTHSQSTGGSSGGSTVRLDSQILSGDFLVATGSAVTGISLGSTGGTETVPQNMALDYYIKAVADASGPTVVSSVTSSDTAMIDIDVTDPSSPILDIQSDVAFGIPKLDADIKLLEAQIPDSVWDSQKYVPGSANPVVATQAELGTCIYTNSDVTFALDGLAAGGWLWIYNDGPTSISLIQGTGMTLRKDGSNTAGTKTLAAYGLAKVWVLGGNSAVISGASVS